MNNPTFDAENLFANVHGFLSADEAKLLYRLASEVQAGGCVVEVGSYQGRSTISLALGAKQSGAWVWAIDNHVAGTVLETEFGMGDNQRYYENVSKFGVGDVLYTINLSSQAAFSVWDKPIELLWIDGSHKYEDVRWDFDHWTRYTHCKVAMHDTSGHFPSITQALDEILASQQWKIVEQVDAIAVLERG